MTEQTTERANSSDKNGVIATNDAAMLRPEDFQYIFAAADTDALNRRLDELAQKFADHPADDRNELG